MCQCIQLSAQFIPATGQDAQLEIGNWNVEWYGNASNGPSNDALQKQNVTAVLYASQADIWGLCEISDATAWDSLQAHLPMYGGIISTWSQTQKTALLYKKDLFTVHYSRHILASKSADFANGRLPLEVALLYKNKSKTDTLYILVIHLKANVGTLSEKKAAYALRVNSSKDLKGYLDTFGAGKKWAVIGDWNDDLDTGILDSTATPFRNLKNDSAHYYFTTKKLTDTKEKSTVSYPNVIDHQCISPALKKTFMHDSCKVWKVDKYIAQYGTTTSDHYPVVSEYNVALTSVSWPKSISGGARLVYYNGAKFIASHHLRGEEFEIYSITGNKLFQGVDIGNFIPFSNHYYLVRCKTNNTYYVQKIFVP